MGCRFHWCRHHIFYRMDLGRSASSLRCRRFCTLQRKPINFDEKLLIEKLMTIEGISQVSHIHAWSIDGETNVLSLHIKVDTHCFENGNLHSLKHKIRDLIARL